MIFPSLRGLPRGLPGIIFGPLGSFGGGTDQYFCYKVVKPRDCHAPGGPLFFLFCPCQCSGLLGKGKKEPKSDFDGPSRILAWFSWPPGVPQGPPRGHFWAPWAQKGVAPIDIFALKGKL